MTEFAWHLPMHLALHPTAVFIRARSPLGLPLSLKQFSFHWTSGHFSMLFLTHLP